LPYPAIPSLPQLFAARRRCSTSTFDINLFPFDRSHIDSIHLISLSLDPLLRTPHVVHLLATPSIFARSFASRSAQPIPSALQSITIMAGVADEGISTLWRVRKTVHAMLLERGYVLTQKDLSMTLDEFKAEKGENPVRESLTILASKKDNPADQIFVFWANDEKLGVAPVKNYVTRMDKEDISRAILILRRGITTFAKRILLEMAHPADPTKPRRVVELFEELELLVNITEHIFVPKHQLLTDEEKKTLLAKYKLKETQLPRIQHIDPIARFYGLQKGNVVKIIRPSETAGRYVTYRLVV